MAASVIAPDEQTPDSWAPQDDQAMGPVGSTEPGNGASLPADDRNAGQDSENRDYPRGSSVGDVSVSGSKGDSFREKQVKPNKVYVGGLPEHARQEDLQSCFGKIGNITNIEMKVGYGFVEFDTREAAEESVAKYHEGYFMGNKIRVELSHGGGRTAKYSGDPGACFKCGEMGHWARECPNHQGLGPQRRAHYDPPLIDRIQREYPPPPRNYPPPRDDPGPPGRYPSPRDLPPRDSRYDYPPPRDLRRPPSPRDYRDYPPVPPPSRAREYDDFRRGPPVSERDRYLPAPSAPDYRGRYPPPPDPSYRGYGGGPPPQPPGFYDRYDRRHIERYPPPYPPAPPPGSRLRTPPRARDDFDRPPPTRDYPGDLRGRAPSPPPPRYYPDYPRTSSVDAAPRYRRRSESPPRSAPYEPGYSSGGFSGNGYSGSTSGGPASNPPPSRGRDFSPPRSTREPGSGYRRP